MKISRSVPAALKSSTLFTDIEQSAMQTILGSAESRHISAKRNITIGGDEATHLFLVQEGRAHYYHLTRQGESVLLAWLAPGDVIGLVSMLKARSSYMASADAISDCELLAWKHSVLSKLVSRHPILAENGLRIALGYLRCYVGRHIGLVTKTAEERLAETLLRLIDWSGEIVSDGIDIRATNDELAGFADVSPFTASRVLSNWERKGVLSKKRGRVVLKSPESLIVG
jgi:CRP/FNR family transcriptional regulator, nitrogen oxide reductase regulator